MSVVESEAVFFKGDSEGGSPVDEGVRAREEEMDAEGVFEREEIPKATAGVGEGILEEVGKLEKVDSSPPFEDMVGISTEGEAVGVVLTVPPLLSFPAKGSVSYNYLRQWYQPKFKSLLWSYSFVVFDS